jgi:SAM-dependent methyltransferase
VDNVLIEDRLLGPAAPSLGWVPAPRYLLRRRRILHQLRNVPPCEVVEIGAGAGMLLQELAAHGFSCTAVEASPEARELISTLAQRSGRRIRVHDAGAEEWSGRFPLVMAFEVLEHIEDDAAALAQWTSWLAPGGTLLLSVPAHPRQWNAADVWAGHFRRYRKRELERLVAGAGLRLEHVECFGYPLGNLTERIQARQAARGFAAAGGTGDRESNNHRSGIERGHVMRLYPMLRSAPGRLALRAAFAMQALFSTVPLGNGYLLRARKP